MNHDLSAEKFSLAADYLSSPKRQLPIPEAAPVAARLNSIFYLVTGINYPFIESLPKNAPGTPVYTGTKLVLASPEPVKKRDPAHPDKGRIPVILDRTQA